MWSVGRPVVLLDRFGFVCVCVYVLSIAIAFGIVDPRKERKKGGKIALHRSIHPGRASAPSGRERKREREEKRIERERDVTGVGGRGNVKAGGKKKKTTGGREKWPRNSSAG